MYVYGSERPILEIVIASIVTNFFMDEKKLRKRCLIDFPEYIYPQNERNKEYVNSSLDY